MSQRLRLSFLRGYVMAKKRSIVTDSVMNTDPTRPMCAKPYLNNVGSKRVKHRTSINHGLESPRSQIVHHAGKAGKCTYSMIFDNLIAL